MAKIQLLELVGEHKKSSGLSYKKITTKANLSQSTIKNWAQGLSKKPRRWQDLAQFAAALKLNLPQVNQLLKAAGHPSIQALRKKNKSLELLAPWKREEAVLQIPRLLASAEYRGRESEQARIEKALFYGRKDVHNTRNGGGWENIPGSPDDE